MFLNPFSYCSSSFSPTYFSQQEQVILYTTAHALSLLKWFARKFDCSDKDLVNITSKPYLLATCLSYSDIPFLCGRKSVGVF